MIPLNYSYKPLPEELTIKPSDIHGLGLFSVKNIRKFYDLGITHVMNNNFDNGMIRTPLGGFINDSDSPNCVTILSGNYRYLYTLRDIKEGEELTLNYILSIK